MYIYIYIWVRTPDPWPPPNGWSPKLTLSGTRDTKEWPLSTQACQTLDSHIFVYTPRPAKYQQTCFLPNIFWSFTIFWEVFDVK